MQEYETKAVILSKETIGETDAQVALYTELLGKIELTAKGLKKIVAKLSHHLEPLNLINATVVAVNHKHLTSALAISTFSNVRKNELALSIALRGLKMLKEGVISPERDDFLWRELISFLNDLENLSSQKQDNLILGRGLYFLSRLARALGVLPDSLESFQNDLTKEAQRVIAELISEKNFNEINQGMFSVNIYKQVEPIFKKLIFQAHN